MALSATTLSLGVGGALILGVLASPRTARAQAARTFTWMGNGGNSAWETNGNWDSNLYPDSMTTAVSFLTGVANTLAILNADHSIYGLTFADNNANTATSFMISENGASHTLDIYAGGIANNTALTQTIDASVALENSQSFTTVAGGTLSFTSSSASNQIDLQGNTLTIGGPGNTSIASNIVDSSDNPGALMLTGYGTLTLLGNNTYSGTTTIHVGTINVGNSTTSSSLGTGGNIIVSSGSASPFSSGLYFNNASSAGSAKITSSFSTVSFGGSSSAGSATITNTIASYTTFTGSSSAGSATIKNNSNSYTYFESSSSAGSASITNSSDSYIFFENSSSAGSATIINTGSVDLSDHTGSLTIGELSGSGTVALGGNQLSIGGAVTNANTTDTISGVVQDVGVFGGAGGSLVKAGAGTLALTAVNTYTGGTTINSGELSIGDDRNVNTGAVTLNGGLLQWTGGTETFGGTISLGTAVTGSGFDITNASTDLTVASNLSGGGGLTLAGIGTLTLTGSNTYAGATTINSGTLLVGNSNASSSLGTGPDTINGGSILEFSNASSAGSATIAINGGSSNINGAGGILFFSDHSSAGTATVANDGSLSFMGSSTAGSAHITNASTLGFNGTSTAAGASVVNNSSATLDISGHAGSLSIGELSGAGTVQLGNNNLTVGALNTSDTISSAITSSGNGGGSLTKTGSGALTLTGTNTYSGGTTVSQGTLIAQGTALGTGLVTVNSGGTLSVGEASNAAIGTSLTTHSLSVSSLLLVSGSTAPLLTFNLGPSGTSDVLNLTGSGTDLMFSGSSTFDLGFASATGSSKGLGPGTYTLIKFATPETLMAAPSISSYTASTVGNLSAVYTSGGNGFSYIINSNNRITGLQFTITGAEAVPEPSALALLSSLGLPGIPVVVMIRRKNEGQDSI